MTESETPDTKAIREAKRAYFRNWRKTHPDNVKRAQERFWKKQLAANMHIQNDNRVDGSAQIVNDGTG